MKINALCTADIRQAKKFCDKLVGVSADVQQCDGVTLIQEYDKTQTRGDIYLPTMTDEDLLENACDYIVTTGARAIVRAAYDLNESGIIEAKYKLSPVMLLHRLGVLDKCIVAGGVCLDNDDLDLMAQENVPLIILPTADAGYGHGFAPVCAALKRGVRVGVGTFDGKYNRACDINYETDFLKLTANAEMSTENALSDADVKRILAFE